MATACSGRRRGGADAQPRRARPPQGAAALRLNPHLHAPTPTPHPPTLTHTPPRRLRGARLHLWPARRARAGRAICHAAQAREAARRDRGGGVHNRVQHRQDRDPHGRDQAGPESAAGAARARGTRAARRARGRARAPREWRVRRSCGLCAALALPTAPRSGRRRLPPSPLPMPCAQIDDLVATGGTLLAGANLVREWPQQSRSKKNTLDPHMLLQPVAPRSPHVPHSPARITVLGTRPSRTPRTQALACAQAPDP